eukprot:Skav230869  [mRNA]  locus=scaffold1335:307503:315465:- [translate_table: standard]
MAEKYDTGSIPTWDGQAKSWRRYTKEVAWYVSSTPVQKRRYVASKLIGKLQGPARLLAMSWNRGEFDSPSGTLTLLKKLSASPLVRKTLPNTAAIMQQYLSFRRRQGESMATFLVRETLGYEEFSEALQRLWEEQQGIDPAAWNFGLPPVEEERESWDWWRHGYHDYDEEEELVPENPPVEDGEAGEAAQDADGAAAAGAGLRGSVGSSPSHGHAANRWVDRSVQPSEMAGELSLTDSFIMGVLRGWRLLQAACLSPEETRDILSTTQNKLDFEAISQALQSLWDEQLLGHRGPSNRVPWHQSNLHEWETDEPWDYDDWFGDDWWEGQWQEEWPDHEPPPGESSLAPAVEETDEQLREAFEAEQAAEQLAAEARRTWAEAQKTTQQLRKDRGFGHVVQSSSNRDGCFNCGGPHLARDCPDRRNPPFPSRPVADLQAFLKGKGKGKNKEKPTFSRPPVNAYSMFDLGGMELQDEEFDLAATQTGTDVSVEPKSDGMLDCGATASAAPDVSVRGLISAILAQDKGAEVRIEPYMQPFFRFGNGKWGQALYRVTISSNVSGQPRKFSLFSLPNPEVMNVKNIVPILVGMDHLGPQGCQMLIDFGMGYVIDGVDPSPQIYQLATNSKGHYVYDIVYHLTRGKSSNQGPARVHVCKQKPEHVMSLQFRPLEFYHVHAQSSSSSASSQTREHRQALLWQLFQHSRDVAVPAAQMCTTAQPQQSEDVLSFREQLRSHGVFSPSQLDDRRRSGILPDRDQEKHQDQATIATFGPKSHHGDGPPRPPVPKPLAMLQQARGGQLGQQCPRELGALQDLRCSSAVHPKVRFAEQLDDGEESCHGGSHVAGTGAKDEGQAAHSCNLQGNDGQDHGRQLCAAADRQAAHLKHDSTSQDDLQDQDQGQGQGGLSNHVTQQQPEQLGGSGSGHRSGDLLDGGGEGSTGRDLGGTSSCTSSRGVDASSNRGRESQHGILNNTTSLSRSKPLKSSSTCGIPVPHRVASHVMKMAALMTASVMSVALNINLEERTGLWEVACSNNSWLSSASEEHGITSKRINYANGYDLYKHETWLRLAQERKQARPRKIWISLPCTKWCRWNQINYNTPERREVLEAFRRRERKVLRWAKDFVLETLDDEPDTDFYWEWPYPCSGWTQRPMIELEDGINQREQAWLTCRIDGCRYNMKNINKDAFIKKQWAIKTTDEIFHREFRSKCCPRNHQHALIQGKETAMTSFYPRQMVVAIARHWRRQLAPLRHVRALSLTLLPTEHQPAQASQLPSPAQPSTSSSQPSHSHQLPQDIQQQRQQANDDAVLASIPKKEQDQWEAKLRHYHRAAGHPSNKNLIHLFKDAGLPEWKLIMAKRFTCSACESIKMGGSSSGQVPPASTQLNYRPWQAVGMDASDWLVPGQKIKIRFILMIDLATKLKAVYVTKQYGFLEMQGDTTQDLIRALSEKWLCDKPKPEILIPDNSTPFKSRELHEFCSNIGVFLALPPEKESWAHGVVESSMKDIKMTASAIQLDQPTLDPYVTMLLACASLNSTEYTRGFSSFQWAYGKDYSITDEDARTFANLDNQDNPMSYEALVRARQDAESVARKTRALRVLSRLKNSSVRQPLRTFTPTQLVKVWRREWPAHLHQGRRGGGKKSVKPHWIGPGRVVFHEILPHQSADDHRRHIVWVLIGTQLMRCSVHSVRPVTDSERAIYEINNKEDPTQWRSIADLLPQRDYTDLTDQVPNAEDREHPDLPDEPDPSTTLVPLKRMTGKSKPAPGDLVTPEERRQHLQQQQQQQPSTPPPLPSVNEYDEELPPLPPSPAPSIEYTPSFAPDSPLHEPEIKRPKLEDDQDQLGADIGMDMNFVSRMPSNSKDIPQWINNLVTEDDQQWNLMSTILDKQEEFFTMEFDLFLNSKRTEKDFLKNPNAFLVRKMKDTEVNFGKLSGEHRALFTRAKGKEVSSFLQNEAVRKCLNDTEIKEALGSGRILRARWVLTWKLVPPEDREGAINDSKTNVNTLHTRDGLRKAKARIVLLGYEHPELGSSEFKTSSPVQSMLARNVLYQMVCQHDWSLEGLDLATAFLQTAPASADARLWTSGVAELREALGIGAEGVMRIMKNIYGSTTAPRGLWLDLHQRLSSIGGRPAMGERCLWLWTSEHEKDPQGHPQVIGMMGGHVDDFHRIGNPASEEWQRICKLIDGLYTWGTAKRDEYRHAGTDLKLTRDSDGNQEITVNQQYYIDMLVDVNIPPDRLRDEPSKLTSSEMAACRAALGSLQWLAVQTQPQLCSRCNILLSELVKYGKMSCAYEIQQLIGEVRRQPCELKFFKLKTAKTWRDVIFITLCDQAHSNRPGGDSTGGMVTVMAGPEARSGAVCPMVLLSWRTWKLRRKAIGSNDAEVQATLEGEDHNFRVRLLWCELHGAGWDRSPFDQQVEWGEKQVREVPGILCTDSKGGYDAVMINESPLLGLSNLRSALQAMQLRENMIRVGTTLRWLASDYDLGDSMTKKRPDSRVGLLKFMSTRMWCIAYDPSFTSAKKNHSRGKSASKAIDDATRAQPDFPFWAGAATKFRTCQSVHSK